MPETRVTFRGRRLNVRTRDMLLAAEHITGRTYVLSQGSYNRGGVTASAGTHDGGGALDLSVAGLSVSERDAIVRALRQVGFAAWYRAALKGVWPEHIHCIAVGDPELSAGAQAQVEQYRNGRNGLRGAGHDNGPSGYRAATWETFQAARKAAAAKLATARRPVLSTRALVYAAQHSGMDGAWGAQRLAAMSTLKVLGLTPSVYPPTGTAWDAHFRAAWKHWQLSLGYTGLDADGIPGEESVDQLCRRAGYKHLP